MPATRGKHRPWSFTKRSHAPLTAIILPSLSSTAACAGNAFSTSVIVAFVPREEQRGEFRLAEHPDTQPFGFFHFGAGICPGDDIVRLLAHARRGPAAQLFDAPLGFFTAEPRQPAGEYERLVLQGPLTMPGRHLALHGWLDAQPELQQAVDHAPVLRLLEE